MMIFDFMSIDIHLHQMTRFYILIENMDRLLGTMTKFPFNEVAVDTWSNTIAME